MCINCTCTCVCLFTCIVNVFVLSFIQVLSKHSQLLARGLYADHPSVKTILRGDVPTITNSAEQQFLHDFIKSKQDSSGGRLAR